MVEDQDIIGTFDEGSVRKGDRVWVTHLICTQGPAQHHTCTSVALNHPIEVVAQNGLKGVGRDSTDGKDVALEHTRGITPNEHVYRTQKDALMAQGPKLQEEAIHVDDFIDVGTWPRSEAKENEAYARWVLAQFRWPATLQADAAQYIGQYPLYAMHEGNIYRVTGASRLGDIYLQPDFSQTTGYTKRVFVWNVSRWILPAQLQEGTP